MPEKEKICEKEKRCQKGKRYQKKARIIDREESQGRVVTEFFQNTVQGGVAREGRRKGQRCKRKRLEETVAMNAYIIFYICCTILVAEDVLLTFNTLFRLHACSHNNSPPLHQLVWNFFVFKNCPHERTVCI
jgi:hypothetical protein